MLTKEKIMDLVEQMNVFPLKEETIHDINNIFYSYENILPAYYDIILILTSSSINRMKKAIEIYHQKHVKLLISGGNQLKEENLLEGEKFYLYALCHGVDPKDIILELDSRNTYENFVNSILLLKKLSLKNHNIILVTSANHMPRALLTGEKVSKELEFSLRFYPVVSYATLVPKDTWYKKTRAISILKDELEKLIRYDLIKK